MNDIRSILAKIDRLSEGDLTPVNVKHGLNKQQQKVPQMPALFRPAHISVLKNKTDPEHPASKFFVGAESKDSTGESLDETGTINKGDFSFSKSQDDPATWLEYFDGKPTGRKYNKAELDQKLLSIRESVAKEDVVSTVKKRLGDYLQDVATAIKQDKGLVSGAQVNNDRLGPAVKTITTDDGHEIKIHGNEDDGFRISVKNKPSKSHFATLDEASIAVEMFCNRRREMEQTADYIEEKS